MIITFEEFCLDHPELNCIKRSELKENDEVFEANKNGFTVILWA